MAVSRERIRVSGKKGAATKLKTAAAAAQLAEIFVGKRSFQTLRDHKDGAQKVLTSYADAIKKAQRLGRPAARERGTRRVAEIMKAPDMLSAREFAPLIGASHETVNQKRKSGEVLALNGATRGMRYPKWQVTENGRLLPGLADVARELSGGPWTVYRFLLQHHPELDGATGLEALKRGRVADVISVARSISEGTFA